MADEQECRRFATINDDELGRIMYKIYAKNTMRATETAIRTLRTSLKEKPWNEAFQELTVANEFIPRPRQINNGELLKKIL